MKISIIIPAFNAEKTIKKCLDSVLQQTYNNLEIIIINDGSTDCTDDIIQEYQKIDSRIVYINNTNHGVSYSRNYGLKIATGDYITFVDSDDYLDIDCYELLIDILNKNKFDFVRYNLKNDGIGGFNNNIYELADKEINLSIEKNSLTHFFYSVQKIPCLVMLLLIKREIAQKIEFNENLTMMEDVDFYLQLFTNSQNCYFSNLKKYNYYVNLLSVSHSPKYFEKNIFGVLKTNKSIKEQLKNNNSFKLDTDLIDANHLRIILNYLKKLYQNNKKSYKEMMKKLRTDELFKNLLKSYRKMNFKDKLYYYFIIKNIQILEYAYMFSFFIVKKIKN